MRLHEPDLVKADPIKSLHARHHVAGNSQGDVRVCGPGRLSKACCCCRGKTGADDEAGDLLARAEAADRLWGTSFGDLSCGGCL